MTVHPFATQTDAPATLDVPAPVLAPDPKILATAEERGWPPGFFERFYGCIQDEAFEAPVRMPPESEATFE